MSFLGIPDAGEEFHFGVVASILATLLSASLTFGEDDVVLASFGGHKRSIWHRCQCRFAVGATAVVVTMLVLTPMSFGDRRTLV